MKKGRLNLLDSLFYRANFLIYRLTAEAAPTWTAGVGGPALVVTFTELIY